jgi:hypothetical protein
MDVLNKTYLDPSEHEVLLNCIEEHFSAILENSELKRLSKDEFLFDTSKNKIIKKDKVEKYLS